MEMTHKTIKNSHRRLSAKVKAGVLIYLLENTELADCVHDRGWRYLPKPQAEADNANRGLNNSRYPAKTEFNNYFIIHMDCFIIHMDHFIIHMG